MKTMMRCWFQGTTKTVVFVEPPFPEVGDTVRMPDGTEKIVKRLRAEQGIEVKFPEKARTVC